jgi:transposase
MFLHAGTCLKSSVWLRILGIIPRKGVKKMSKENIVSQIKKATRRKFSAEDKIRIVLEGLRGQISITELCRKEGIAATMYYKWSKAFLEAGKNGLTLDTKRDATTDEVRYLKEENQDLKKAVAELHLEVQRYKKSLGM